MERKMAEKYGEFGGSFIPELLMSPVKELADFWKNIPPSFHEKLYEKLVHYAGRPTPVTEVPRFAQKMGGPRVFLKREDLLHTGAHKLNNCLGQCLIAKEMGKQRVIAETGAGQHGVATATVCAHLGIECVVYMGKLDVQRQEPNVKKMRLLGAKVVSVDQGAGTLKDAINEAMRDWSQTYDDTYYCLGSVVGPYPYPEMVAKFQSVIGKELKEQLDFVPTAIIACVGGGSNAIGIFSSFLEDKVRLIGVEAEGSARFHKGTPGVFHGTRTYLLQTKEGQIDKTHSISAGLDYPGVGPEHAQLFETKRVEYGICNDKEALEAFVILSETEGIIPALESAHALAYVKKGGFNSDDRVVINLSGRGDKDLPELFKTHLEIFHGEESAAN